jgi:hypothetical protein
MESMLTSHRSPFFPTLLIIFYRYYECTIDDVLDDGTCTIVFDGFESAPLTVVRVRIK